MNGFYIKQLIVRGNNLKDAKITFEKGANLVTGASDTGKSYVFAAITYALGASEPPKEVEESKGYTDIFLEIGVYGEQKEFTLYRKIGQNKIEIKEAPAETFATASKGHRKLNTTGSVDSIDHISYFLLSLCKLENKKVLYNRKNGITHNLSFDILRKLTFVDEERIIKTESPFYYSSQVLNRTKGQALLSLLMTGNDYSDIVAKEDQNAKETKINGKLEFLAFQISQLATGKDVAVSKLAKAEQSDTERYLSLEKELQANLVEARAISSQKNALIAERHVLQEELLYKSELLQRFGILERQYITDADRLVFILETSVLASQLGDTVCPICTSPLDQNHVLHFSEKESFRQAAAEELNKNISKLAGLRETINNLKVEEDSLKKRIADTDAELEKIEVKLKENFSPKIYELRADLREFLNVEKLLNEISFTDAQIAKLYVEKDRLENLLKSKTPSEEITILSYALLSELCDKIEKRLDKWNYESHAKVNFDSSYQIFDIVISAKNRRSYGKGKRSISYAACLFGLLDYCAEKQTPFSNLIVMDSPLTTFEEKRKQANDDTNEVLTTQVLKSFFLDLVNLPQNSQVIIFDNKEPDVDTFSHMVGKINLHVFTGTDEGRSGFFPI